MTSGAETAYYSRVHEFTPAVKWSVVVFNILVFCVLICKSLFEVLVWPLDFRYFDLPAFEYPFYILAREKNKIYRFQNETILSYLIQTI